MLVMMIELNQTSNCEGDVTSINRRRAMFAAAGLAASCTDAAAQTEPSRPLRIVVPYPPGGPTDALVRLFAEAIRPNYQHGVVVENKSGGAGTIAARAVLASPADGRTILIGNNQTHVTAPYLIKDAGYDPLRDFQPVAQIAEWPHVVVVRKTLDVNSIAGLLTRARAEPGRLTYGSTGPGSGTKCSAVFR